MVEDGKRPYLNEQFMSSSSNNNNETATLVNIMKRCWNHDPKQRPDIFTIVRDLQEIISSY